MNATRSGARRGQRPQRLGDPRVAARLDDQPRHRRRRAPARRAASRSNPFCGSSRPIAPNTAPVVGRVEPDRARADRAGRPPCPRGRPRRSRPRDRGIRRRDPRRRGSMPLRIPKNRSPRCAQQPVEAHAVLGPKGLGGERRADRVHEVGPLDAGAQQVDAVGPAHESRRPAAVSRRVERAHGPAPAARRGRAAIQP